MEFIILLSVLTFFLGRYCASSGLISPDFFDSVRSFVSSYSFEMVAFPLFVLIVLLAIAIIERSLS